MNFSKITFTLMIVVAFASLSGQAQQTSTGRAGKLKEQQQNVVRANNLYHVDATNSQYLDAIGYFFAPNENKSFPFDQVTLHANQGELKQN